PDPLTEVTQTPSIIWKTMGDSAQMICTHILGSGYYQMYWYRQHQGESMRLIVFTTTGSKDFGDFKEDKYSTVKTFAQTRISYLGFLELFDMASMCCANYEAYFGAGTKLTVLDPQKEIRGPVVEVLPPSEAELCKKKKKDNVTLLCVAKNFYPDHVYVSWEIDNDVKREKTKDVPIEKDGNYIISSRLRVPKKDWKSGKKFTCIVYYYNGTGYEPFQDSISGVLLFRGASSTGSSS
uniref:Ig-like domain-containing protein n=1 Tax=Denticeps clupeoides TaxID=299321 RepID=A0AAY4AE17_9TELE